MKAFHIDTTTLNYNWQIWGQRHFLSIQRKQIASICDLPNDGTVFFHHDEPLVYQNTIAFQMIRMEASYV